MRDVILVYIIKTKILDNHNINGFIHTNYYVVFKNNIGKNT